MPGGRAWAGVQCCILGLVPARLDRMIDEASEHVHLWP
jgi:hypothetical protein